MTAESNFNKALSKMAAKRFIGGPIGSGTPKSGVLPVAPSNLSAPPTVDPGMGNKAQPMANLQNPAVLRQSPQLNRAKLTVPSMNKVAERSRNEEVWWSGAKARDYVYKGLGVGGTVGAGLLASRFVTKKMKLTGAKKIMAGAAAGGLALLALNKVLTSKNPSFVRHRELEKEYKNAKLNKDV